MEHIKQLEIKNKIEFINNNAWLIYKKFCIFKYLKHRRKIRCKKVS
jgi:hypothetical protein